MQKTKITIIGNSVALRVRPPIPSPYNLNYGQLLENLLESQSGFNHVNVNNNSLGATTIYNTILRIDDIVNHFPDFFIINLGVVDASTREIPLWFYRIASSPKSGFLYVLCKALYRKVIIKFRPLLVRLRGKRSWVSLKSFEKKYDYLVNTLIKETNARLILMPINSANERIEKELPGSKKRYLAYNRVISKIALKYKQCVIDVRELESSEHFPDGVHYSREGHKIIADKIVDAILKNQRQCKVF